MSASRFAVIGSASVLRTAALSFALTSAGVPRGVHTACQLTKWKPVSPASSTVGIFRRGGKPVRGGHRERVDAARLDLRDGIRREIEQDVDVA